MKIYGVDNQNLLYEAINELNEKYDGNVSFRYHPKRLTMNAGTYQVSLRVKDSKGYGASRTVQGRRSINACWHVFGDFIDILFDRGITAVRTSSQVYRSKDENWADYNTGSMLSPVMASDRCGCNDN